MGFLDRKWAETAALLRQQLEPHLAPGERLLGALHATQAKTFSAQVFAVGVTPVRVVLLPVNRKMEASGEPVVLRREDIRSSSVWGWGGSVAEFISASAGQQIRIETGSAKFKLMAVGGSPIENAAAGDGQLRGLDALVDFVLSARC